ncbi:MAG: hypothetical protein LBP54_07890 [Campylobacteraceae bacterium]|jgi:hypothetical protein|nr:hypothetical protein [Campylobacteraceae bacterium]
MLINTIKCFGKKALIRNKQILDNLGDNTEPKQPIPKTKNGERIREFVIKALKLQGNNKESIKIDVAPEQVTKIKNALNINLEGYSRVFESDYIKHDFKEHGLNSKDKARPITEDDFLRYEDIVTNPDRVAISFTDRGQRAITYVKKYDDKVYVVEEIRTKRKSLAFFDMYKSSLTRPDESILNGQTLKFVDVNSAALMLHNADKTALKLHVRNDSQLPNNNIIIPQSWWQNQVDKAFDKVGAIIHKADKGAMNLTDKPAKGALRKAFGDSFVTFSKTFEDVGEMVENLRNATRQIYEQAASRREMLDKLLTPEDKVALHKALDGNMDPKDLPKHLESLYNNIRKLIDDNANALIKAGALKEKYKIDDYLKRYYKKHYEEKKVFFTSYFNKKKFKARKDLTYDERIALEMIEDSSIVVPNTIAEQRTQLVKANFLKQVADRYGVDEEIEGFVRMSDETVGGGIMKYGALGGKYVPREVAYAIKDANIFKENLSFLEDVWYPVIDHIKVNVTVKNPTTHLYNFLSNFTLSFLHGDMRALGRMFRLMTADKDGWKELVKRANAQGIVSKLGDFEDGLKNVKLEKGDNIVSAILKNIYMAEGTKTGDFMRKAYGWEDLLFKIAHFDKLTRQGVSDEIAARAAKEAYVNYAKPLPAFVRMLDKTGLSPFLGYTYRSTPMVLKAIAKHPDNIIQQARWENKIEYISCNWQRAAYELFAS